MEMSAPEGAFRRDTGWTGKESRMAFLALGEIL